MESFLSNVARSLWKHYGEDISALNIVVPNMRSRLFFTEALSKLTDRPIWSPHFTTIDELIGRAGGLTKIDPIRAVVELYKIYSQYHPEELERFYFWGEVLLADFDQIDKYRIDAGALFTNLRDLQELDGGLDYMNDEQLAVVRRFREALGGDGELSGAKRDFLTVWNSLGTIYGDYTSYLRTLGMGYGGMLYRDVAERIKRGEELDIPAGNYAIVGFNALSECEKILFDRLHIHPGADFFWDTDDYYIKDTNQEAGLFLRDNIVRYPQPGYFENSSDNFARPKNITVVSAPSASIECKAVGAFLASLPHPLDKRTAIVLADEGLLVPVLYSLPVDLEQVNITMGYPVCRTVAFERIEALLMAPTQSHWRELAASVLGEISSLAESVEGTDYDRRLQRECYGLMAEALTKLVNTLGDCGVEMTGKLFSALARRMLSDLRIPFNGEPLAGVQIMGILETRNLDFENVILLSVNDERLPAAQTATTFIPHNLRYGYGLPTPSHHDGVYAYYFYRLIQRAGRVELLYCSKNDSNSTGEPSRYIYQLQYEAPHTIEHRQAGLHVNLPQDAPITIDKTPDIEARLAEYLSCGPLRLSPTAINNLLTCPLKFYFRSVEHIKVNPDQSEELDASTYGNLLHRAMQLLYQPLIGLSDPTGQISALINSDTIWSAVDTAIITLCFESITTPLNQYGGELRLARESIHKYINNAILPYDAQQQNWKIVALELPLQADITVGNRSVQLGGVADRIDLLNNTTMRIVDYKTGRKHPDFTSIEALFDPKNEQRGGAPLQTLIYSTLAAATPYANLPVSDIIPALYYVRHLTDPGYSPYLAPKHQAPLSYSALRDEFELHLHQLLADLFNPAIPFSQYPTTKPCTGCDFTKICNRI